jgi:hypothetical protein
LWQLKQYVLRTTRLGAGIDEPEVDGCATSARGRLPINAPNATARQKHAVFDNLARMVRPEVAKYQP